MTATLQAVDNSMWVLLLAQPHLQALLPQQPHRSAAPEPAHAVDRAYCKLTVYEV
jgi:hypothetical protein